MKMSIQIGDIAPDFELESTDGSLYKLSEEVAKTPVLLNFYIGDFGINCTNYMNIFNERLDDLLDLGISMIGINHDSMDSHTGFKKMTGLKWELLFDKDKNVAKTYGAIVGPGHMVTGFTNREFILVGKDMKVLYTWKAGVPKDLPEFDAVLNGVKEALQ